MKDHIWSKLAEGAFIYIVIVPLVVISVIAIIMWAWGLMVHPAA